MAAATKWLAVGTPGSTHSSFRAWFELWPERIAACAPFADVHIGALSDILSLPHLRGIAMPARRKDAEPQVQSVRPDREVMTTQRLPYFVGISGQTVDAKGLSMHLVVIPPGGRAEPHVHVGYETGIYVLEGTVRTRWGPRLEHEVVSRPGEFLFVPPGVPHEAINSSATEPARAVVARNDPAEQDKVQPYRPSPDGVQA
jgi:uncharacterized RmlC-like cupin family protein